MSFERHHANRQVDRNLARARDLRSEYVNACLLATVELIARAWRTWRRSSAPGLEVSVRPVGKQLT